jgi:metallophosphoesterase (TIGR00282 family)
MPLLRAEHKPDLIIVNGENAAGGVGITEQTAEEIFAAGAQVITLGNHAYRQREAFGFLNADERVVRPLNHSPESPGRGWTIVEAGGMRVAVVNLSGAVQLQVDRNPFAAIDELLEEMDGRADAVFVDFHAEVTSEKVAMGWHLDGRVAAVCGTHTHVPTADPRILPGGTAHITDVGMTGSRDGVLGVKRAGALESLRTGLPVRFETAGEDVWVMGCLIEVRDDGLSTRIEQILLPTA